MKRSTTTPKLTKAELQIMERFWSSGDSSIREIQETFSEEKRPAYSTVQTMIYRLEKKGIVRRIKKVGNFHMFSANISRENAQRSLIEDLLSLLGGHSQPLMSHLVESGHLTLKDIREAEKALQKQQEERGQ